MDYAKIVAIRQNTSNPRLFVPCIRIPRAIDLAARGATGWPSGSGFRLDFGMMYFTSTGFNGYAAGVTQLLTATTIHTPDLDDRSVVVDGSFTISSGLTPPDAKQQVTVTAQLVFLTAAGVVVELGSAHETILHLA